MNIALILAGGTGMRMCSSVPKQYMEVGGKPIIAYCLEIFGNHMQIDAIQIVAEKEWYPLINTWAGEKCRGFSEPGMNRQISIFNALSDILQYASKEDIVIVHDAVRPLVASRLISECIEACKSHDGALPVLPVTDTVYLGDGKHITSLIDRTSIYAGQAPEAFVLGKYYEANKRLLPDEIHKINGSTEPAILAGMDIELLKGEEMNFKITTEEDLDRFKKIMGQ